MLESQLFSIGINLQSFDDFIKFYMYISSIDLVEDYERIQTVEMRKFWFPYNIMQ